MNCKYCNQDLSPFMFLNGFKFCPFCGTGLKGERRATTNKNVSNILDSAVPPANL